MDVAAGQLLVLERGLSIANADGDDAFLDAPLDLVPRSRIAAAGTDELCRLVVERSVRVGATGLQRLLALPHFAEELPR